jgi:hypothetical protein
MGVILVVVVVFKLLGEDPPLELNPTADNLSFSLMLASVSTSLWLSHTLPSEMLNIGIDLSRPFLDSSEAFFLNLDKIINLLRL